MANLLKFEFRKVFRSKYFYILLGVAFLYTLLNGLTLYFVNWILENLAEEAGEAIDPGMFDYNSYTFTKAALSTNLFMIVGIFVAIFTCEDNGHGTSKNIVAKGYNRLEVYFSKYIVSLILVFAFAIVALLASALFGLIAWGADSFTKTDNNMAPIIIGQILCVIVYHALFFAVAFSVGKSGGAIVINLLVPMGITLLLTIGTVLINKDDFSFSNYWIDGILVNFTGDTNEDLFLSNFILLFVYLAAAELVGPLIARRKQY